jgi:predicted RNA binding protein YcfA (HicA-like mRNA interferase family)
MPAFGTNQTPRPYYYLRKLGFTGPFAGGKHEFMQRGALSLTIPNPHGRDIGPKLLAVLLRQAGIDRSDWEKL